MANYFEIVELSNGDVALRRTDEEGGDALLKIHFSDDAKASLSEHHTDVARVMIEAGMKMVGELSGMDVESSDLGMTDLINPPRLH